MRTDKLLIATDFSDASGVALSHAVALASAHGAELVVMHAYEPDEPRVVRTLLEERCAELTRTTAWTRPLFVEGFADEAIIGAASTEAADLVIVGSHGKSGVRRLWLGSVAERVVRQSAVPVLVARGPAMNAYRRVLVGTDFSEQAERALEAALALAAPEAHVDVVHALRVPVAFAGDPTQATMLAALPELEAAARAEGNALVARYSRRGLPLHFALDLAPPRDAILRRVEQAEHDLVALGSHGRRGLRRLVMGSVAETIVRHAPCSVLIGR